MIFGKAEFDVVAGLRKRSELRDELTRDDRAEILQVVGLGLFCHGEAVRIGCDHAHGALKNEFISSISHELRTPLTIIKGWAITLQSESDKNTIVGEGLMLIEKESDRLTNMVEELLDFSRLSSGRMELKVSEINLSEIAKLVNKQLQFRAKTGGIDMVVNYDEKPVIIMADKDRIKQILINLDRDRKSVV